MNTYAKKIEKMSLLKNCQSNPAVSSSNDLNKSKSGNVYMNGKQILKGICSVLLSFLLVIFSVEPALASSTVELTYPNPDLKTFYSRATGLVTERKNIVIHTNFRSYDSFPDDLKDLIEQDRTGHFRINPNAQAVNHVGSITFWAVALGATCGVLSLPFVEFGVNPIQTSASCAGLGAAGGEIAALFKEFAKHSYIVAINRGDIFLNVVYK
jgi:hypothetical protein